MFIHLLQFRVSGCGQPILTKARSWLHYSGFGHCGASHFMGIYSNSLPDIFHASAISSARMLHSYVSVHVRKMTSLITNQFVKACRFAGDSSAHDPLTQHHKYILSLWIILGVNSILDGLLTGKRRLYNITALLYKALQISGVLWVSRDQGKGIVQGRAILPIDCGAMAVVTMES